MTSAPAQSVADDPGPADSIRPPATTTLLAGTRPLPSNIRTFLMTIALPGCAVTGS